MVAIRFPSGQNIVFSVADFETLMAGGNFMHRVISYVVNEVLVNSLANRYYLALMCYYFCMSY